MSAAVLGVSAVTAISAVGLAAAAVLAPLFIADQKTSWALFGFEVVVLVASVLGVMTGLNRYREGPGLALACIAATILVASGLGWQGAGRVMAGVSLTPLLAARLLSAVVLGALAAWVVLSRRREAWRPAILGGTFLALFLVGLAALAHPAMRRGIAGNFSGNSAAHFLLVVLGFALMCALVSAGAHLVIRAFEMGRVDERGS